MFASSVTTPCLKSRCYVIVVFLLALLASADATPQRRRRRGSRRHGNNHNHLLGWPKGVSLSEPEQQQNCLLCNLNAPDWAQQSTPLPSDSDTLDVWILAGQSNMNGENSNDGEEWPHPLGDSLPGKILMYPNTTQEWQDAENNMDAISSGCSRCTNSLGPAMAFGRTLLELKLSLTVGFVPTALGGSSLAVHWEPGADRYRFMINQTIHAMAMAEPKAQLRGMLWAQGETDGSVFVGLDGAMKYGERLRAFIHSVRADLASYHPLLPIVIVKMSTKNRETALPHIHLIRRQQEEVIATTPAVISADLEGLTFYMQDLGKDLGGPTDMHLTKSGVCQLGVQMAEAYSMSGQQLLRPIDHLQQEINGEDDK